MNRILAYSTRAGVICLRVFAAHRAVQCPIGLRIDLRHCDRYDRGGHSRRHRHRKGRVQGHRRYRDLATRRATTASLTSFPTSTTSKSRPRASRHLRPRAFRSRPMPRRASIPRWKSAAAEHHRRSECRHAAGAEDRSRRRFDGLRSAAGFEPAGGRPELHQPATSCCLARSFWAGRTRPMRTRRAPSRFRWTARHSAERLSSWTAPITRIRFWASSSSIRRWTR